MKTRRRGLIVLSLAALSMAGFAGCSNAPKSVETHTEPIEAAADKAHVSSDPITHPSAIADAAARVEPSVVTINTEYRPQSQYTDTPYGYDQSPAVVPRGTGSGVILTSDGVIVTNNHVVQNSTKINVTLQDGREMEGRVIGADPTSDLAVVKVDQTNLPAVTLGDSTKLRVGEWVVAVGNPLGVGSTVTAGIVSALHKSGEANDRQPIQSAIQTDAAINPGNSGGALADIEGRLIGINTAIATNNGGSIGIGFAIPVNTVREITDQLIKQGHVVRPWFGIAFGTITDRARAALNIPQNVNGIIVGDVISGGPADAAGIHPQDVITKIDDTDTVKAEDLQKLIQGHKVGDEIHLSLWRQGSKVDVTATLREQPRPSPGR